VGADLRAVGVAAEVRFWQVPRVIGLIATLAAVAVIAILMVVGWPMILPPPDPDWRDHLPPSPPPRRDGTSFLGGSVPSVTPGGDCSADACGPTCGVAFTGFRRCDDRARSPSRDPSSTTDEAPWSMTRPTGTTTSATFLATPSPSARDNLRDVSMQDPSRPEMSFDCSHERCGRRVDRYPIGIRAALA